MKNIIVTGDITADWNIARLQLSAAEGKLWNDEDITRACLESGGAAMLGSLLQQVIAQVKCDYRVLSVKLPKRLESPLDNRTNHSYAMWKPYPRKKGEKSTIWRIESFLGLDGHCGGDDRDSCYISNKNFYIGADEASIVVIDDAGLLFKYNRDLWPKAIIDSKPDWIIVKMAYPVAKNIPGTLWNYLIENHAERTILICTVNDLRKCSVRISYGQSWEKTAQDVFWEINNNEEIVSLKSCKAAIISFGTSGSFLYLKEDKDLSDGHALLLYDPDHLENSWDKQFEGMMVGYNVCLTAGIVREMILTDDLSKPPLMTGIRSGVYLMRKLMLEGYGVSTVKKGNKTVFNSPVFPTKILAAHHKEPGDYLCWRDVPDPTAELAAGIKPTLKKTSKWSILDDICQDIEREIVSYPGVFYYFYSYQELFKMAADTVRRGHRIALRNVPIACFGKLVTADRREIEAFNNIAVMIQGYCQKPTDTPLCIAVFGQPGSGKSFGIKQVAKSVARGKIDDLVFNLTQFSGSDDLIDALHQVRDIGLSGKIPLVFWDEFDTEDCRWLHSFLAPMQDGVFQDGQITYHIGSAVFVFAGGTSSCMEEFGCKNKKDGKFSQLKGRDFISRLHNFLNVLGPNKVPCEEYPDDYHYLIRRAMLIRGIFEKNAKQLFSDGILQIDEGVLRAFLSIDKYKHGARSIESIIRCSSISDKSYFEKSSLPSELQLEIHVNGKAFLAEAAYPFLGKQGLNEEKLNLLATALHAVYCEGTDKWKTEAAKMSYAQLDEDMKEENRRNVLDMLSKLKRIGYAIERADSDQSRKDIPEELIEQLAEIEHIRWMKSKINLGWTYDSIRDDKAKKHPCLLPWKELTDEEFAKIDPYISGAMGRNELPEEEKEKDRVLVKAIPRILAMEGFALRKPDKEKGVK